jgi:hypothetical protein
MHIKGLPSLITVSVLCLPSVIGGVTVLYNLLLPRHLAEWGETSAALIGSAMFFGLPLLAIATLLGVIVALRSVVSPAMKLAHLIVVVVGVTATICLAFVFHFAS